MPKVIDFGVAKALEQQLTDKTLNTGFAQLVGTPLYMSPEQAEMGGRDIDTRSDIYSLGVLLYELLTGMTPFDKERMRAAGYDEMRRIIREEEPARPSTRQSTPGNACARRQSDPKRLSLLLRGELDWIVMKALEKDRNRRYETASAFAADVHRYLRDEPVLACPPSAWYRLRMFARRNRTGLRIAAAAALMLLLAVVGVGWALWDQATRRIELAERIAETEQTVNAALIQTNQWRKQAGALPNATSREADAALVLWRQAEASLAPAETALRTGTADDRLHQRVLDAQEQIERGRTQAQRKANLLRGLDDARMMRSIWIETHFDYAGAAAKYAATFAAYGLEVKPGRTEALAQGIRAEQPAVREALIVALDYWGDTATRAKTVDANAKTADVVDLVRAIADAADDDPWRQKYRAAATAGDLVALRALSRQARRMSLPPTSVELLAISLRFLGDRDEALNLLRWARGRHLADFWIHFELGLLLYHDADKSPLILEETIGCYRTALALRPAASAAHNNLGNCLYCRKQLDEAIAEYRKAIEFDPKNALAHNGLGDVLMDKEQCDEAIAEYRQAIDFDPKLRLPYHSLGNALMAKRQWDEAITAYRRAIDLDPQDAESHNNLGNALTVKDRWAEASAEYRQAIKVKPSFLQAHIHLGQSLLRENLLDEASVQCRKTIELNPLNPKLAAVHDCLGRILMRQNRRDEAIAEYKKAIKLDSQYAPAYCYFGNALSAKNQSDAAMAEYRKAIAIDPKCVLRPSMASAARSRPRTAWTRPASHTARSSIFKPTSMPREAHLLQSGRSASLSGPIIGFARFLSTWTCVRQQAIGLAPPLGEMGYQRRMAGAVGGEVGRGSR